MGLAGAYVARFVIWILLAVALVTGTAWIAVHLFPALLGAVPITPGEALDSGGHTVIVKAVQGTGVPTGWGDWQVKTESGRPPSQSKGVLVNSQAQIVVGKDWIGQVQVRWSGSCGDKNFDQTLLTDLIGKHFGWQDRTLNFQNPC